MPRIYIEPSVQARSADSLLPLPLLLQAHLNRQLNMHLCSEHLFDMAESSGPDDDNSDEIKAISRMHADSDRDIEEHVLSGGSMPVPLMPDLYNLIKQAVPSGAKSNANAAISRLHSKAARDIEEHLLNSGATPVPLMTEDYLFGFDVLGYHGKTSLALHDLKRVAQKLTAEPTCMFIKEKLLPTYKEMEELVAKSKN
jgi:hypothetical protein